MSLVNIKTYELLKETYDEFIAAKAARDTEAREASSKKREVGEELTAAQAKSSNCSRSEEKPIEANQQATVTYVKPKFGFLTVDSEIRNQIGDGRIIEAFQPDLDELNELREMYRKKVQAVLVKMHMVN